MVRKILTLIKLINNKIFIIDKIITDSNNLNLFSILLKNQFPLLLEGVNLTIFAFGQTSTGKTFTMKGKFPSNEGIIPLSIKEIFNLMDNNKNFKVKCSYFELYNENINDLLDVNKKNLEIRENSNKEIIINNLTEILCDSTTEILNLFFKGEENRKISYTKLNVNSSRSHTIFRLNIENLINNKKYFSVLNLIDLAGSENCNKTLAKGKVLKEGININKSLLALSNVINKLSQKNFFCNFRESKLTRLLQNSLSGNSKTNIICTITDVEEHYSETYNTILFGIKAKNIKTFIKKNFKMFNENDFLKKKVKTLENILKTGRKCFINEEIVVEKNNDFFTTNKKVENNNKNKGNNEIQISIKNIQNELNNIKKFFCFEENYNNNIDKNICRNLLFNNENNKNENLKIINDNNFNIINNSKNNKIIDLEEEIKMLKENNFNLLSQNIHLRNKIKYFNDTNNKENINILNNNQNLMITPLKYKIENEFLNSTFLKKKKYFNNDL